MGSPEPQPPGLSELLDVSQHGEAGVVAALIDPGWPRYLVDVGAHDGRSLSNSFPFVQLGWSGVLVEPLPEAFEHLAELYRDRPDVRCLQLACAATDGERQLVVGEDGPAAMTGTLRAGARGTTTVPVKVRTLTTVLDECDAPRDFSLLLVDAEGMDHEVLSGLDLTRYRPRVIVTEDDPEHLAAKYGLLQERGYVLYTVIAATNSIWISSEWAPAAPQAGDRTAEAEALPTPLLSPQEAIRTVSRDVLERRCAELERSRDEIWRRLVVVETSRSWRLTRPLRDLVRHLRFLRRGG
jgi:FkbM family methyltransferase